MSYKRFCFLFLLTDNCTCDLLFLPNSWHIKENLEGKLGTIESLLTLGSSRYASIFSEILRVCLDRYTFGLPIPISEGHFYPMRTTCQLVKMRIWYIEPITECLRKNSLICKFLMHCYQTCFMIGLTNDHIMIWTNHTWC